MKSIGYSCENGHWMKDCKPVARFTWREFLKWAIEFIIIAAISFGLAFLFVKGLEKDEFVQQAKQAKWFDDLNHQGRTLPAWGADGPAYSPGHEYYLAQAERRGR